MNSIEDFGKYKRREVIKLVLMNLLFLGTIVLNISSYLSMQKYYVVSGICAIIMVLIAILFTYKLYPRMPKDLKNKFESNTLEETTIN